MNKVYDRIYWANNSTPALNAANLNAMSKGLDDLDQRVVDIAGMVLETVPLLQEMMEDVETLSENPPYIGANGNWYVWSTSAGDYVDSGVDASISVTIEDVTAIAPDAQPYVTNSGTDTDPIFHLFIPRGQNGTDGDDGVSVTGVSLVSTSGKVKTYRMTFSDGSHFDYQVTDGADGSGTGDMLKSAYDPNSAVENAGGIPNYVDGQTDDWTSTATVDANGQVTFTGLNDAYGYSNPCFENKLVFVTAISKSGSGSNVTLVYTLKGASQGDVCKLRVFK